MTPALTLAAAFIGLSLLWNLPVVFSGFAWPGLATAALEVVVLFALLALVRRLRVGRPGLIAALIVALATTTVVVLKVAELAMRESLARPFNPLLDAQLARSMVHLLTETLGGLLGWLSVAGLALTTLLVFAAALAAVRATQRALDRPLARHATLVPCAYEGNDNFTVHLRGAGTNRLAILILGPHEVNTCGACTLMVTLNNPDTLVTLTDSHGNAEVRIPLPPFDRKTRLARLPLPRPEDHRHRRPRPGLAHRRRSHPAPHRRPRPMRHWWSVPRRRHRRWPSTRP